MKKWEPDFFAEIDDSENDADYLREQQCCSCCGAYIGNLPGYFYIESDICPNCAQDRGESWSEELERMRDTYNLGEEEIGEYIKKAKEMKI